MLKRILRAINSGYRATANLPISTAAAASTDAGRICTPLLACIAILEASPGRTCPAAAITTAVIGDQLGYARRHQRTE